MQVILLERMPNLGQMGEMVTVKMGYARNFLLPKKKALRATKENILFFENQKVVLEADNLKRKSEAEAMAVQMKTLTVTLIRTAGESGILYGSIRARDIADAVIASNYKIERSQVQLIKPIKHLGLHQVRVLLHPDVSFELTVNIAQSEEEAAVQQKLNQEESA
jgi:large subunit ribosomal protein L9